MPKFIIKNKIAIAILVFLVILGILFLISHKIEKQNITQISENQINTDSNTATTEPQTVKTVLEINDAKYEGEITGEISVYDFMNKLRNEGKINFTEKNYMGIGKFIDTINGIKGSGDKNWIYYVNGKKAEIGVSNYKINPGDVVSWKYKSEQ